MGVIWTSRTSTRQPSWSAPLRTGAGQGDLTPILAAHSSGGRWGLRSQRGLVLSDVGTPVYGVDPYFGSILQPTSGNYVRISGMPNTGYPFTMAMFVNKNRTNGAGANRSFTFGADDFGSYGNSFFHQDNHVFSYGSGGFGAGLSPLSAGWTLIVCVFESASSRSLYNVKNGVLTTAVNDTDSVPVSPWPAKLSIGQSGWNTDEWFGGDIALPMFFKGAMSTKTALLLDKNPWQLFAPERRPLFFNTASGSNTTGTLSNTLDAATLTGVGNVTRSATLAVTLDAATLAGIGTAAVTNKTGTLAVTLDTATLTSVGAVTRSGTLNSTLDAATLSGAGTVAVGTNRDGTLASTLGDVTLAGVGAVTTSGTLAVTLAAATLAGIGTAGQAITGTLAVTLDAATLAGIGSVGQPRTGTLSVTLDNVTLRGIGAIPAAPSTGGGKTTGKNLSRKQKKKLKAVESQEWLKAEETARQLLSDRFTKQTPQEKAQALETHIESLVPVIEALKAITDQIEDVQETVQETKTEELTEHKQILNKFDALITKMTSIEELLIIMLAQ